MAFGAWMHRAAIHRGKNAPGRIMDVGGLLGRRQPLWISHRREVAVVGIADPARARQIGTIFAGAAAAEHRLASCRDDIGIEAFALDRKTLPIEFRIVLPARAEAVICECRLMGIDEGHAIGGGIAAQYPRLA